MTFSLLHLAEVGFSGLPAEVAENANLALVFGLYGGLILVGLVADAFLLMHYSQHRGRWQAAARRFVWRPVTSRDLWLLVSVVLGCFVLSMLVQMAGAALRPGTIERDAGFWVVVQSALTHWPALLFVLWLVRRRRLTLRQVFGLREGRFLRQVGQGLLGYVAIMPVVAVASWLFTLLLQSLGYDSTLQDVAVVLTNDAPLAVQIYLGLMAVVVAPVFEEVFFRGVMFPVAAKSWGLRHGLVFVSLCFAAIHLHAPSFAALFLLAAGFSVAYMVTGSLVVPIVMHGLFNAVNMGLLLYLRNV